MDELCKPGKPLAGDRYLSSFLAVLILLQISSSPAASLTDLDWRLCSSKYAQGVVSNETAFHGTNCAELKFSL